MFLRKPNPAPQPLLLGSLLTLSALSALGTVPAASAAGTLDAPAPPTSGSSAMYNINDVCNRLDSGAAGSTRSGAFSEPASGPAASNCTLNDVMAKAPAVDASAAAAGEVADGKTYWSLKDGVWGKHTGTATAGANVTGTDGSLGITIPDGLYSGGKTATASDTDLTAANIKSGVNLFGVAGTHTGIGGNVQDTSSGDATAPEIASGKKAWVDGSELTGTGTIATGDATAAHVLTGKTFSNASGAGISGTMANNGAGSTITPTTTDQPVAAGYWSSANTVKGDANLTGANIKSGTTIFGVAGTLTAGGTYSAAVPKTGQTATVPLNPAPAGSDGALQKGVALPSPRFTDNSDGTVTDNLTGLIWLKNANCAGIKTWADALTFANTLADGSTSHNGGDCGLSDSSVAGDWRLPNYKEWVSLVNLAYSSPALSNTTGDAKWTEGQPFSSVQTNRYWSSTAYADYTDYVWLLYLSDGVVNTDSKTVYSYVWPVRGGQ